MSDISRRCSENSVEFPDTPRALPGKTTPKSGRKFEKTWRFVTRVTNLPLASFTSGGARDHDVTGATQFLGRATLATAIGQSGLVAAGARSRVSPTTSYRAWDGPRSTREPI